MRRSTENRPSAAEAAEGRKKDGAKRYAMVATATGADSLLM